MGVKKPYLEIKMFLNTDQIKKNSKKREIIFWGCAEDWIPKTKLLFPKVNKIVDINKKKIGSKYASLECLEPHSILNLKKKYFIVVTSGATDSIDEILKSNKWRPGKDYAFSPVFYDFKQIQHFEKLKLNLIISSSDYPIKKNRQRSSRIGGGLFLMKINSTKYTFKKIIKGSIRQFYFSEKENLIYAIEYVKCEILIINNKLKIKKRIPIDFNHLTGITVYKNSIIVTSSARDIFIFINKTTGKVEKTINFGKKYSKEGLYHINDCWLYKKSLYFSYFSKTGSWRNDVFDGGISVLKLDNGKINEVVKNLYQPHTPTIINDTLHFFESTLGKFYTSPKSQPFNVNGFIRGLDHFNNNYVIGLSETLYMSRVKSLNHILLNSGIYIYHEKSKLARFYPTLGIKNIHALKIIKFS